MDGTILLSNIQMLDIFFRFATAGALVLLFVFIVRHSASQNRAAQSRVASLSLILCVISYVLLTAPVDNVHYGWLRPPLLLFTNCTVYALLAVYWQKVHGTSLFTTLPTWAKVVVVAWFIMLVYLFVVKRGLGVFHHAHDVFGLILLIGIVVDAIRDFDDDLVESRRDIRRFAITFISVYMLFLTLVEVFYRPLKDHWVFSLTNASLIFLCALFFAYRSLKQTLLLQQTQLVQQTAIKPSTKASEPNNNPLVKKLTAIMEQGIYTQNGLTIAKLAEAIRIPEHQLRVLINQELNFDNFSRFLNSYRIPVVCEKLKDPTYKDTPVLSLALDSGYNSIAPFNRAFKEINGMTPTEYRRRNAAHF